MVRFFWEREGRDWYPGSNMIQHPGNPPRWFMRDSFALMKTRLRSFIAKHYGAA